MASRDSDITPDFSDCTRHDSSSDNSAPPSPAVSTHFPDDPSPTADATGAAAAAAQEPSSAVRERPQYQCDRDYPGIPNDAENMSFENRPFQCESSFSHPDVQNLGEQYLNRLTDRERNRLENPLPKSRYRVVAYMTKAEEAAKEAAHIYPQVAARKVSECVTAAARARAALVEYDAADADSAAASRAFSKADHACQEAVEALQAAAHLAEKLPEVPPPTPLATAAETMPPTTSAAVPLATAAETMPSTTSAGAATRAAVPLATATPLKAPSRRVSSAKKAYNKKKQKAWQRRKKALTASRVVTTASRVVNTASRVVNTASSGVNKELVALSSMFVVCIRDKGFTLTNGMTNHCEDANQERVTNVVAHLGLKRVLCTDRSTYYALKCAIEDEAPKQTTEHGSTVLHHLQCDIWRNCDKDTGRCSECGKECHRHRAVQVLREEWLPKSISHATVQTAM